MNAKRMIAVLAVLVMAFAAFAVIPAEEPDADIISAPEEIVYLHGDVTSQLTQTAEQIVIVDADLNIKDGGSVSIAGKLIVNEGVTITVDAKNLRGLGSSQKGLFVVGDAEINGNIVSKSDNGFAIQPKAGKEVVINGTVSALGDTSGQYVKSMSLVGTSGKITVNGSVIVGTNAEASFSNVFFEKDSSLTVLGIANGAIYAAGYINVNGATDEPKADGTYDVANGDSLTINVTEASANIEIVEVFGKIKVSTIGMFAYSYGGVQYYVTDNDGNVPSYAPAKPLSDVAKHNGGKIVGDVFELVNVSNLKVKDVVKTDIKYDERESKNDMDAEIKTLIAPLDESKPVEGSDADASIVSVSGFRLYVQSMTIHNAAVTIGVNEDNYPCVFLEGDVIYALQDADVSNYVVKVKYGSLYCDGCLVIMKNNSANPLIIDQEGYVQAVHYAVKDADNNTDHYYTTLRKAIDNGAIDICTMGMLWIDGEITVPASVKITVNPNVWGNTIYIDKGNKLIIADGAQFVSSSGDIKVDGTFVIENINYGITLGSIGIKADVQLKDGARVVYTNLHEALNNSKAGDVINVYTSWGSWIDIFEDLVLPEGVTLSNTESEGLLKIHVCNGAQFVIEGTLMLNDDEYLVNDEDVYGAGYGNGWNTETPAVDASTGEVKDYSVVKIGSKGMIVCKSISESSKGVYDMKSFSGAYFEKDGEYCITGAAYAFENILDAKDNTVSIVGEVTIDNLKVSGTEKERIEVDFVSADVTLKNFTFAYGIVTFDSDTVVSGSIGTSGGSIDFSDKSVKGYSMTFCEEFVDEAMNMVASGSLGTYDTVTFNGAVYVIGTLQIMGSAKDGLDNEAEFIISKNSKVVVTGEGASLTSNGGKFIVDGTLTITNKAALTSMSNLCIVGTLDVQKIDGKAATATIFSMVIGTASDKYDDMINTSALVTGSGTYVQSMMIVNLPMSVIVCDGSKVESDVLVDWMANVAHSTEFYVDGKLCYTHYVPENNSMFVDDPYFAESTYNSGILVSVSYSHPTFENRTFNAWQTYDENTGKYVDIVPSADEKIACIGDVRYQKVYADISNNIYDVTIIADVGIDDIFIDGKIILKDKTSNTFTEKVSAGTHTITYTLANGYSGNASIVAIDGKTISGSGLTFVIDDDKAGTDMKMEITVSGIEKSGYDTDPETHDEKASGLTTTEILLIVVVVIIAIMAVVLILRLNRS